MALAVQVLTPTEIANLAVGRLVALGAAIKPTNSTLWSDLNDIPAVSALNFDAEDGVDICTWDAVLNSGSAARAVVRAYVVSKFPGTSDPC